MRKLIQCLRGNFSVLGAIVMAALLVEPCIGATPSSDEAATQQPGDAQRGRAIFNGKGICFYCHGWDGFLDQKPQLAPDTARMIARLNPSPSDLREPAGLKVQDDKERFRTIREGHSGTGMLPDTTLKDDEISDLLAYLASLRREGKSGDLLIR